MRLLLGLGSPEARQWLAERLKKRGGARRPAELGGEHGDQVEWQQSCVADPTLRLERERLSEERQELRELRSRAEVWDRRFLQRERRLRQRGPLVQPVQRTCGASEQGTLERVVEDPEFLGCSTAATVAQCDDVHGELTHRVAPTLHRAVCPKMSTKRRSGQRAPKR